MDKGLQIIFGVDDELEEWEQSPGHERISYQKQSAFWDWSGWIVLQKV